MKKKILSLIVLLSLLTSCKDDDDENGNPITLEGSWKLTAWNCANAYDFNGDGVESTNLLNEFDCNNNELLVFSSNGTGIGKSDSYVDIIATLETGTTNSYNYSISCVEEQNNSFFTWSRINENTISMTNRGETGNLNLEGNTISLLIEDFVIARSNDVNHAPAVAEDLIFIYTKQ